MYRLTLSTLSNNVIQLKWNKDWYQEEIKTLAQGLFSQLTNVKLMEEVIGADRESFRFQWQKANLWLHFDYYSQSSWIEAQEPSSSIYLNYLQAILEDKIKKQQ